MDLIGNRYGRLVVISRAEDHICPSGYRTSMWNCLCDCGKTKAIRGKSLVYGVTKSCGCLAKEKVSDRASKHHGFGTRLYAVWNSMRQRCNNEKHRSYGNYGGRGIRICKEWDDFSVLRDWAIRAGYDPLDDRDIYTLDRIDVDGDYTPENCRWVDMRGQANNKRNTIYLIHNGCKHSLSE